MRRARTAFSTFLGALLGLISPEIQTFVSTTTRSASLPHLSHRLGDVPLDVLLVEPSLFRDPIAPLKERVETPLPLVLAEHPHSLRAQVLVQRFADETRDRLPAALTEGLQRPDLLFVQIDVRSAHRPYIIHLDVLIPRNGIMML